MDDRNQARWRLDGVRVVHSNELDINTAQTPGMSRAAAITHARAGAEKLWAGTVVIHPMAKTGAHHHGPVESVIYVVSGRARMRWGERLEFVAEAGPAISSTCRLTSPIRKSTRATTSRSHASSCAAVRRRLSSIWTCRTWSRTLSRSSGSTTSIRRGADNLAPGLRPTAAGPDAPRGPASRRARAPGSDAPRAESRRRDRR